MPIDSIPKKLSLMDFEEVASGSAVPYPTGSLDQGDLQHGLWSYSGIAYVTPATPTGDAASSVEKSAWAESAWVPRFVQDSSWSFTKYLPTLPRLFPKLAPSRLSGGLT
jgi:hypothetical protein